MNERSRGFDGRRAIDLWIQRVAEVLRQLTLKAGGDALFKQSALVGAVAEVMAVMSWSNQSLWRVSPNEPLRFRVIGSGCVDIGAEPLGSWSCAAQSSFDNPVRHAAATGAEFLSRGKV